MTLSVVKSWTPHVDRLPEVYELATYLVSVPSPGFSFPCPINVPGSNLVSLSTQRNQNLLNYTLNILKIERSQCASGQDGMHYFLDTIILSTFRLMESANSDLSLHIMRDCTHSSTVEYKCRPDFLLLVNNILLLRGEEEESDVEKARGDLKAKTKWQHRYLAQVPYIFGYAATWSRLNLYAMTRCDF